MFEVGDKVIIKTTPPRSNVYLAREMKAYLGYDATITAKVTVMGIYTHWNSRAVALDVDVKEGTPAVLLDIDNGFWTWAEAWLEPIIPQFLTNEEYDRIKQLNDE